MTLSEVREVATIILKRLDPTVLSAMTDNDVYKVVVNEMPYESATVIQTTTETLTLLVHEALKKARARDYSDWGSFA